MGHVHCWIQFHEVLEQVSALDMIIHGLSCPGQRLHLSSLVEDNFSNRADPYTLSRTHTKTLQAVYVMCMLSHLEVSIWRSIYRISRTGVLRIFNNLGLHTFRASSFAWGLFFHLGRLQ